MTALPKVLIAAMNGDAMCDGFELGLVHGVVADAPARALELAEEIASLPPMSVANAKRALYLGADSNLQAAFEVENMNWTEVMQSLSQVTLFESAARLRERRGGCQRQVKLTWAQLVFSNPTTS